MIPLQYQWCGYIAAWKNSSLGSSLERWPKNWVFNLEFDQISSKRTKKEIRVAKKHKDAAGKNKSGNKKERATGTRWKYQNQDWLPKGIDAI